MLIAELNAEAGAKAAKELGCASVEANVTKREDWEKVLQKSIELYGGVDVVVNNAGTCYRNQVSTGSHRKGSSMLIFRQPSHEVSDDEFDTTLLVNFKSIYLSVAVIVPWMKQNNKRGNFIQIASTGAIRPKPNLTWYNGSKAAVCAATRSMALEYAADKIRFNSVCPQFASTGL